MGLGSSRPLLAGLVLVNLGCLLMNLFQTGSFWFVWVSPAVLALYAVHMTRTPIEGCQCAGQDILIRPCFGHR